MLTEVAVALGKKLACDLGMVQAFERSVLAALPWTRLPPMPTVDDWKFAELSVRR